MILEATSFNNMAELKARWQEIQHLSNEGNDDINGGGRKKDKAKEDRTEDWIKKQKEEGQKKKAEREAAKRGDVYIDHKVHLSKRPVLQLCETNNVDSTTTTRSQGSQALHPTLLRSGQKNTIRTRDKSLLPDTSTEQVCASLQRTLSKWPQRSEIFRD